MTKIKALIPVLFLLFSSFCYAKNKSLLPENKYEKGFTTVKGVIRNATIKPDDKFRIIYNDPTTFDCDSEIISINSYGTFCSTFSINNDALAMIFGPYYDYYMLITRNDTVFIDVDVSKRPSKENDLLTKDKYEMDSFFKFEGANADINTELGKLKFNLDSYRVETEKMDINSLDHLKETLLSMRDSLKNIYSEYPILPQTRRLIDISIDQLILRELITSNNIYNYRNGPLKPQEELSEFYPKNNENDDIPILNSDYYSFIKLFDINNQDNLYGRFFSYLLYDSSDISKFLKSYNEIDSIEYTDIESQRLYYIESQKLLSKFIGDKKGIFFDYMNAVCFKTQIEGNLSLHDWQKEILKKKTSKIIMDNILEENERFISYREKLRKETITQIIDIRDKDISSLNQLEVCNDGKIRVLLNWAFGCFGCKMSPLPTMPMIKELSDKGVNFIYFIDDNLFDIQWETYANKLNGIVIKCTSEQRSELLKDYELEGFPNFVAINAKSDLLYKLDFDDNNPYDTLESVIRKELERMNK